MQNEEIAFTVKDRDLLLEISIRLDLALKELTKLNNNYVEKEVYALLIKRVEDLEDNNKWVVRTVIGIIILAILGLVIATK